MALSDSEKARLRTQYGPWAVVTGASSGIGRELATRLAEAGLHLILTARRTPLLTALASSLRQAHGIEVVVVPADLSTAAGIAAVQEASAAHPVSLCVLAAGYGTSGYFVEADAAAEAGMVAVNVQALLALTHHFSQRFAAQGRGGLILLSSLVAFQGVPYAANYAATKAYVQSLAEALAIELRPRGVDVLAAAPGPVASDFGTRAGIRMNLTLRPEQVGIPILRALGRRAAVLPGWLSKLLVYALRTVPRRAKVRIMQQIMGGMTAHQRG